MKGSELRTLRRGLPLILLATASMTASLAGLSPAQLRCEYRVDPLGIDAARPRLSWRVESAERGQRQTAYQVLVASTATLLAEDRGDLWDTGQVRSDQTVGVVYGGAPLASRLRCHWKVRVWDRQGKASGWSTPAFWSLGLLRPDDWQAEWISHRDTTPLHTNRESLFLPPARHYRKAFVSDPPVHRATIYATALGLYELHVNGQRIDERYFTPGWSDYRRRVYYQTFDVTRFIQRGENVLGAVVTEGWYSGYVGYGLLVGYGPNRVGRYFYGKTPALRVQLELEFEDGSRRMIVTDGSWQVTDRGPYREADLIMGETFDARLEQAGWCARGFRSEGWEAAVPAVANGSTRAVFSDTLGDREVDLGFQAPAQLQAYPGPPVRVTEELRPTALTEPAPGVYIFNLGQNIAGLIRLRVRGPAGTTVRVRYGEMLHPDGRLMTENLRRARATDRYVLRGDPDGEAWSPRFTYHGFQYVELTGLPTRPDLEAVTGLVLHSDTPLTSRFECSDEVVNRLFKNIVWTQRANFVEIPTDCPQRDERLGWMGDAQAYVRTATWNADVASFFTKWLDDVEEAQRSFGAYPDYAPYPMAHGQPRKTFGTGWMDAGLICPWTIYRVYGDTRVIERHYDSMARFMEFRTAASSNHLGVSLGNPWGDWLALGETTPVEYLDTCYFAYGAKLMSEMAAAIGRPLEAQNYQRLFDDIQTAFCQAYLRSDGTLTVDTQTAYALALFVGLLPEMQVQPAAARLAAKIAANDSRMATGFLGTRPLLPVLSAAGHHDLAARLLQSRKFPSWGYEVVNGATTIWERWDSYTKEDAFSRHNAAMNSFSHYAFGAVGEWLFQWLAGIDTDGPGFKRLVLRPGPPTPNSNPDQTPIRWVRAEYDSIRGRIASAWRREADRLDVEVSIPPNTLATLQLPTSDERAIRVDGGSLDAAAGVRFLRREGSRVILEVEPGQYRFVTPI